MDVSQRCPCFYLYHTHISLASILPLRLVHFHPILSHHIEVTYLHVSLSLLQDILILCDEPTHEWIPNRVDPWTLWVHLHRYFSTVNTKLQYTWSGVGWIPQMHRNSEYRWPAILILINPCVVQGSTAI